jgi:hypothetical protein
MNVMTVMFYFILALSGILFYLGIGWAGWCTLRGSPEEMPKFLSQTVSALGGVLATNFGAVIGLQHISKESAGSLAAAYSPNALLSLNASPTFPQLQAYAALFYLVGLTLALALWCFKKFNQKQGEVVSTLPELSQSLLGVLMGGLTVWLGVAAGT